jgi:Raf kinase inhibitor-like YbhB/YbcL family protein
LLKAFGMVFLVFALAACPGGDEQPTPQQEANAMSIQLTSTAFSEGASIPAKYTCDGADLSPPLRWSGIPEGAKSIALIADDPDAPGRTFVHWVMYGIPSNVAELPEGGTPRGVVQGNNDFGRTGYGGPCPPPGAPHRYFFKIYALDTAVDLRPGAKKADLERAMDQHILAQGQLMGRYQRRG